jgi:hypothetical protein
MSLPIGKSAMQRLFNWTPRLSWYKELRNIRDSIVGAHRERSEIDGGGVFEEGASISATTLNLDFSGMSCRMRGRLMAPMPAGVDTDILSKTAYVGEPIYADGVSATGGDALSLGADETAYVTLIACNSDGAGGADEDDNGSSKLLAIIAGSASDFADQTEHLSSAEIQAALEASDSVHDGVTGWAHLAQIEFTDAGGAAWSATITGNRNNVVSEA